jgi:hypothetical protein
MFLFITLPSLLSLSLSLFWICGSEDEKYENIQNLAVA